MPTYEYACPKCGYHFEQFQSMRDAPLKKCPKCKRMALKRLIGGGSGIIFKGSGFYQTDYKKPAAAKEGGETKAGGGESKPADSKPASESAKPADSKAAKT